MTPEEYQAKRQARIDRLEARAANAQAESTAAYNQAHQMAKVIPFGQPILVGHHSEKADRAYRDRIACKQRQSYQAQQKAEHYAQKAEAAARNRSIYSDDPEALDKLRAKLGILEAYQEELKADNKALRKAKLTLQTPDLAGAMREAGVSERGIKALVVLVRVCPYHASPYVKHPGYELTNNNANIKRLRERIVELEKRANAPEAKPMEGDGWRISQDQEWGRILIEFDGKPAENVRNYLKGHGWRWARSRLAWVRHLNGKGEAYAEMAARDLPGLLLPAGSLKWWATARGFKVLIRACKAWCWKPGSTTAQVTAVDNGRWMQHQDIYAEPWQSVELTGEQRVNFEAAARDCYCYQGVQRCDFCTGTRTPDAAASSNGEAFGT